MEESAGILQEPQLNPWFDRKIGVGERMLSLLCLLVVKLLD